MRQTILFLSLVLAAICASAQTTYQITSTSGTITGPVHGSTGLIASLTITAYQVNGGTIMSGADLGTITVKTGRFLNGSYQTGANLAAGTITIDIPGVLDWTGAIAAASWTPGFFANGSHFYTLCAADCALSDSAGSTGAFNLSTDTQGTLTCFWAGSAAVDVARLTLELK